MLKRLKINFVGRDKGIINEMIIVRTHQYNLWLNYNMASLFN